jgi:hypothetical protein
MAMTGYKTGKDFAHTGAAFAEEWIWYSCIEPVVKKVGISQYLLGCRQMFLRDGMDKYKSKGDGIDVLGLKKLLGAIGAMNEEWSPISTASNLFFRVRDEFTRMKQTWEDFMTHTPLSYFGIAVSVAMNNGRADVQAVELWNVLCGTMSGCELSGDYPQTRNMINKIRVANALEACMNDLDLCGAALSHLSMTHRLDYTKLNELVEGIMRAEKKRSSVTEYASMIAEGTAGAAQEFKGKMMEIISGNFDAEKIITRYIALQDYAEYSALEALPDWTRQAITHDGGYAQLTFKKDDVINVISDDFQGDTDYCLGWVGDREKRMCDEKRNQEPSSSPPSSETAAAFFAKVAQKKADMALAVTQGVSPGPVVLQEPVLPGQSPTPKQPTVPTPAAGDLSESDDGGGFDTAGEDEPDEP